MDHHKPVRFCRRHPINQRHHHELHHPQQLLDGDYRHHLWQIFKLDKKRQSKFLYKVLLFKFTGRFFGYLKKVLV